MNGTAVIANVWTEHYSGLNTPVSVTKLKVNDLSQDNKPTSRQYCFCLEIFCF